MATTQQQQQMASSTSDNALQWVLQNKLRTVLYTWGTCVSGSLAYQWTRPIPTSLKIIHSRVYAQAITLGALAAVAGIETWAAANGKSAPPPPEEY